jgi:sugar-specific transcriptional regulator TrmB
MSEIAKVKNYLKRLGVSATEAALYIELFRVGPTTALKLARSLAVPRTQVYRELENLQQMALVSADKLSYGTIFHALPLENVESMLEARKSTTEALVRELGSVSDVMKLLAGSSGPQATVRHYYGRAGLRQVNWNLTKARKEFRVFETKHLSQHLDADFARRCRERFIERKLHSFDLTNERVHKRKDLEPVDLARAKLRYIDPKILDVKFEMYIYDEVVTLLDYSERNSMALEIHHPSLSVMMKQLFDAMWKTAEDVEII